MRKVIILDNYQFNEIDGDILHLYYTHGHDGVKDIYDRDLDVSNVLSIRTKNEIKKYFDYQRNNSAVDLMGAFLITCERLIPLFNEYYIKNVDLMNLKYDDYLSIIKKWWVANFESEPSNYYYYFFTTFYSFVMAFRRIGTDEVEYDEWILGRLGIPIRSKKTKARTYISFLNVPIKYRQIVKDYIYDRLLTDTVTTCDIRLTVVTDFAQYLEEKYPSLKIYDLDHKIFSEYYRIIDKSNYCQCTKKKYVDNLKYFLDYCQSNDIINPNELLYLKGQHISTLQNDNPNPLSNKELNAIKDIMQYLPEMHSDMLQLEMDLGMRPIDLSSLEIDDLHYDNGKPYLTYMMYKVRREHMLPRTEFHAKILEKNINYSKQKYGVDSKYIFQVKEKPFNFTAVVYRVNSLLKEHGYDFTIHAYRFRYNAATRMAMSGVNPKIITDFLGQSDFQNIHSYYKPKDNEIMPYINEHLKTIDSLLKISKGEKVRSSEPLIIMNGFCNRSVKTECRKGNACLTCTFYVPKSKDLVRNQLEHELEMIKIRTEYAQHEGFKDIVNYYQSLEKAVINRLLSLDFKGDK